MNTTLTRTATVADAAAALPEYDPTISSPRVAARTRRRTPLLIIAAAIAAALPLLGATPAQAATYRDPTPGSSGRKQPKTSRVQEKRS